MPLKVAYASRSTESFGAVCPSRARNLVEAVMRRLIGEESQSEAPAIELAARLLFHHASGIPADGVVQGGLVWWRLKRVIDAMTRDLSEEIGMCELARIAGVSEAHFFRAFKRSTGRTPQRYRLERRIEAAQAMLTSQRTSLVEIALACGFADQPHMTTVFRKYLGTTPKRLREASATSQP